MLLRLPPVTWPIIASIAACSAQASSNMARKAGGQPHCISCTTPRARDSIKPGCQDMASGCSKK